MAFETVLVDVQKRVGVITLNRPDALNALNTQLLSELAQAAQQLDQDAGIGCLVITGSGKAFAAGADIKEMAAQNFTDILIQDLFGAPIRALENIRKPMIAAVNGFALGGGCELAMLCDTIFAADKAKFGQPEIKLGVIPGIGGSQRLAQAVGKAKAMDMILTGRTLTAEEAERAGIVARIFGVDDLLAETIKIAETISELSLPALILAKQAVNRSQESGLNEGLVFEQRAFQSLFATEDQKEGMAAFIEKRSAVFKNK